MVEKTDFPSLEKLSPDKRLNALKMIVEELKKDISDKQRELEEAERQLFKTEEEVTRIEEIEVPKSKGVKIEELFRPEEKEGLEAAVGKLPFEAEIHHRAHQPLVDIYKELKSIYHQQNQTGVETREQRAEIYVLQKAIEEKKQDVARGEYRASQKAEQLFTASEELVKRMYRN